MHIYFFVHDSNHQAEFHVPFLKLRCHRTFLLESTYLYFLGANSYQAAAFVHSLQGISQTVGVVFLFRIMRDFSIVFRKVVVHRIARYAFGYDLYLLKAISNKNPKSGKDYLLRKTLKLLQTIHAAVFQKPNMMLPI